MPLTAFDPDTGEIILPDAPAAHPQCRDPKCRADLHFVNGNGLKVDHFRHSRHADCPNIDHIREKEAMCPWHCWWQSQTDHPSRIEVTDVDASGDRRRADILTRFGWCIEVQHSQIGVKTIRSRENHWGGKVLWLIDAASDDRMVDFSTDKKWARLHGTFVHHLTTLVAVDDGEHVWVLPGLMNRSAQQISGLIFTTQKMGRQAFIDTWINGEEPPFDETPHTMWRVNTGSRRPLTEEQRAQKLQEANRRARQEAERDYLCEYDGDRERLVHTRPEVVVDLRDRAPALPDAIQEMVATRPEITWPDSKAPDWRKSDASRHPVTKLPAAPHNAVCGHCGRLVRHGAGRLKCDAFWTPSSSTDINPTWAACSVWTPARKDTA